MSVRAAGGVILLAGLTVLGASLPVAAAADESRWSVPVTVRERAGVARAAEPITFGLPLPESLGIRDPKALVAQDARGQAAPVQMAVVARWKGSPADQTKPIKWLLVDLQADAAAGQSATYRVSAGQPAIAGPALTVEERGGGVEVGTGTLAFRVSARTGRLFDWITLGGKHMIHRDRDNGPVLTLAPATMVARLARRGMRDMALSSTHGLAPGTEIAITQMVSGTVAQAGEGYGFAGKYPLQNRQGGRFLRMNPTPERHQFTPGSMVVVAKGRPNEETVEVSGAEPDRSLVLLAAPLKRDHKPGEPILLSRTETRSVAQVKDAHRVALTAPLERDHFVGETVAPAGGGTTGLTFRAAPSSVTVEEAGPLRATVRVHGGFEAAGVPLMGGVVEFTARITAYAGKDHLKVAFTLENNGPYGYFADDATEKGEIATWLLLRSVSLDFPLSMSATTATTEEVSGQAEEGGTLYQDRRRAGGPEEQNFFYRVRRGDREDSHPGRLAGWLHLQGGGRGVTLVARDFWQNYPKSLAWERERLAVGLWPDGGHFPDFPPGGASARAHGYYAFEGGRHKTHEVYLRFTGGAEPRGATQQFARSVLSPLVAVVPGSWFADSKALGMMAPADLRLRDSERGEALARYEKFQMARVHLAQAESPKITIHTMRERIAPARGYPEGYYGWMNFGDLAYGETYSSLHYDWPYGMLLQFVRSGDPAFLDLGREMALHRMDIDQVHGGKGHGGSHRWTVRGLARYEKGGHGYGEAVPKTSHTWGGGLVLYYLLTGDRRAWEAAGELGDSLRARWKWVLAEPTKGNFNEVRHQGWSILNLLHIYRVTSDPADLAIARALFRNSLLFLEQHAGGKGYWGYFDQPQVQSLNEFGWVIDPLVQLHYETGDPDLLGLLKRMAAWVRSGPLIGGDSKGGRYRPLNLPWTWKAGTPNQGGYVIRTLFLADLFAYLHLETRDPQELEWARRIFRDVTFHFTHVNEYIAPGARSPISYTPERFYQSETKIGAWLARHPQTYLYAERLLSQNERYKP